VQITVAEQAGIETRADYYDKSGALRDMLQNHMMQLLTWLRWSRLPRSKPTRCATRKSKYCAPCVRSPRMKSRPTRCARDTAPARWKANPSPGYLNEAGVPANSTTETFVAAKFFIDNWRWRGVPFYLRTGKRLKKQNVDDCVAGSGIRRNSCSAIPGARAMTPELDTAQACSRMKACTWRFTPSNRGWACSPT